ncbi:MAG: hypothetical protein GQ581_01875 [Methyloprofundus sp.]|nr:hypothetical protein [Methyloprofundus sp.]
MKKIIISLLLFSCSLAVFADNLSDSNKMFNWAEINYPQFFYPAGMETFQLNGYLVRHYAVPDIYIGTSGEDVYVYGDVFGGLQHVGQINDFVDTSIGVCTDNFPRLACDGITGTGGQIKASFVSGASCSSAFPGFTYDPDPAGDMSEACGFLECGACAIDFR